MLVRLKMNDGSPHEESDALAVDMREGRLSPDAAAGTPLDARARRWSERREGFE